MNSTGLQRSVSKAEKNTSDVEASVPVSAEVIGYPVGLDDEGKAVGVALGKDVGTFDVGAEDVGTTVSVVGIEDDGTEEEGWDDGTEDVGSLDGALDEGCDEGEPVVGTADKVGAVDDGKLLGAELVGENVSSD